MGHDEAMEEERRVYASVSAGVLCLEVKRVPPGSGRFTTTEDAA
jgi:hypothetical protein